MSPDLPGFVYFIAEDPISTGVVKVGWAVDPQKRLRELQTGNPRRLVLLAVAPGWRTAETGAHYRLRRAGHRLRGEWFQVEYLDDVELLGRGHPTVVELVDAALEGDSAVNALAAELGLPA